MIGYARVSTKKQGLDGLGMEDQIKQIKDYAKRNNLTIIKIYKETESGNKTDKHRPELSKAISQSKINKCKLVIARIDRLSRNVEFTYKLLNSKVDFVCIDMPQANTMTIGFMSVIAQNYRDQVSANTKRALARKKENGDKLGNVINLVKHRDKGRITHKQNCSKFATDKLQMIKGFMSTGVTSYKGLADLLNKHQVPTMRAKKWYPTTIKNILENEQNVLRREA
jgi:DNA invertase Pin-like site-specific DNA recombinase|tara:strand:- start:335 stop:1009 length:675 start_codon:yes stop_codon:yes gene_type:complete